MKTNEDFRVGQRVRVPNGEIGTISHLFHKDGRDLMVVDFRDGRWLTISPIDVEKVR